MSTIIALDASGDACSVSLRQKSGDITTFISDEPRSHAAKFLPFIDQLLADAELSLDEIDSIACAVGPGSFTGLRIALSIAQGLAFSVDLPIIPICTLAAMSVRVSASTSDVVLPLLDARMNEVYWGAYLTQARSVDESFEARVSDADNFTQEIINLSKNYSVIGVGEAWHSVAFAKAVSEQIEFNLVAPTIPLSEAVIALALQSDRRLKPHDVDLLYCRNSVAWDKRQRIRS